MEDVESNREADRVVERLKHAIQQPYEVDGHSIELGVSIGVAYYPEDGMLIEELLDVADRKMYGDKAPDIRAASCCCGVCAARRPNIRQDRGQCRRLSIRILRS